MNTFILAFSILLLASCASKQSEQATTDSLNTKDIAENTDRLADGKWICLQDTSYSMVVINDTIIDTYATENTTYKYTISHTSCTDTSHLSVSDAGRLFLYKEAVGAGARICYSIHRISLSHISIGYEGKNLDFRKVD